MWLCPLTKSMSLWRKRGKNARAEVEKAEKPAKTPDGGGPRRDTAARQYGGAEKSRAVAVPPKAEKAATENQKAEKSAGAPQGPPTQGG